jgi:plasmid stability protein
MFPRIGAKLGIGPESGNPRGLDRGTCTEHLKWSQIGTAAMNLSIKNVPEDVVQRLRERAARHHRSLQGELLAIIEEASDRLTVDELLAEVQKLGLTSASESTDWIRADRDSR